MENGDDLNLILCDLIKDSEGKTPNNRASEVSVNDRIEIGITNDSGQNVVDAFHEVHIQIFALMGVPLAGLGDFGIGVGSEPNDHLRLARLHEFSFDLVPGAALSGIGSGQLQPSIELSLLSIG